MNTDQGRTCGRATWSTARCAWTRPGYRTGRRQPARRRGPADRARGLVRPLRAGHPRPPPRRGGRRLPGAAGARPVVRRRGRRAGRAAPGARRPTRGRAGEPARPRGRVRRAAAGNASGTRPLAAADALRAIVATHLDHEEDVAFSRYRRAFTATEFAALGATALKLVGAPRGGLRRPLGARPRRPRRARRSCWADQPLLAAGAVPAGAATAVRPPRPSTASEPPPRHRPSGGVTCPPSPGAGRRPSIPTPSTW